MDEPSANNFVISKKVESCWFKKKRKGVQVGEVFQFKVVPTKETIMM
jgi:hypothetical protein